MKVHQRIAVKIHQSEEDGYGVWPLEGGARGGLPPRRLIDDRAALVPYVRALISGTLPTVDMPNCLALSLGPETETSTSSRYCESTTVTPSN